MSCIFKGFVCFSSLSSSGLHFAKFPLKCILLSSLPKNVQANNLFYLKIKHFLMPYSTSCDKLCLQNRYRYVGTGGLFHKKDQERRALFRRHCKHQSDVLVSRRLFYQEMKQQQNFSDTSGSMLETEELVNCILKNTEKVDVMAKCIPPSDVEHLVRKLDGVGFEHGSIESLLSGKLWLLQQPEPSLALCQMLLDHGMTPHLVCQVVRGIPYTYQKVLHQAPAKINKILLFLRSFGFSEEEIYSVVSQDSSVLFEDERSVRMSLSRVRSLFPTAETKKVVCMSPNVLSDEWSVVQDKFNYCIYTMVYTLNDIVGCHFFSHSLNHIKDRHIFLLRAGVFKVISRKLHPSLNPNPPLKQVVDSPNTLFVKMVEGMTVQDYVVFKTMRDLERAADESEEEDEEYT